MKALLWKDYRVNRQILIVGFCLLVAPFLAAVGWLWYDVGLTAAPADRWGHGLSIAAQAALMLSQLTVLLLAGHIIAGERRDRSAEFLAYLPPPRSVILTSKAILATALLLVVWGVFLLVTEVIVPAIDADASHTQLESFAGTRAFVAVITIAMFGMAWFGSCLFESPTYSAALGIFAAVLVPFALNLFRLATGVPAHGESFIFVLKVTLATIGVLGFIAGWCYYVRRVEP